MLKVYSASWCPHCIKTEAYLKEQNIPFDSINIETAPKEIVDKVSEINGGEWVVPTLEYKGVWRRGKVFNKAALEADLREMGVQ
ncbi:glutaredoxin family protein [Desulfoluna butyratoxydans]|uniref:Glutaredoxin n=1 Tax=Desulfoluna butyratoxydans TaxID=231438 RepID=A0A4U8YGT9_9BACT|nr:glutaredoxin family protein [Desulfoluna butyratoxydans]VFQ42701.1 glutaredoxin [Desulfoluna butyratoxydans]